jgi:hypothetical protein
MAIMSVGILATVAASYGVLIFTLRMEVSSRSNSPVRDHWPLG